MAVTDRLPAEIDQDLASPLIEPQHPGRAVKSDGFQAAQHRVHDGCPGLRRAVHGLCDTC